MRVFQITMLLASFNAWLAFLCGCALVHRSTEHRRVWVSSWNTGEEELGVQVTRKVRQNLIEICERAGVFEHQTRPGASPSPLAAYYLRFEEGNVMFFAFFDSNWNYLGATEDDQASDELSEFARKIYGGHT